MTETDPSTAPSTGLSPARRKWFALGALGVAAAALLVITVGGIGENLVYYWGPSDVQAAGGRAVGATIRLGGQVAEGSIKYGQGVSGLELDVSDGTSIVHVRSSGVPPQMFREGIGVVVEGTMTEAGYFESRRLMVSHDNEYRAPGDERKKDMKELMRTTKGLEGEN